MNDAFHMPPTHEGPTQVDLPPAARTTFGSLLPERLDRIVEPSELQTVVTYREPPRPQPARAEVRSSRSLVLLPRLAAAYDDSPAFEAPPRPASAPDPAPPSRRTSVAPQRFIPTHIVALPAPCVVPTGPIRGLRLLSIGLWTVALVMFAAALWSLG